MNNMPVQKHCLLISNFIGDADQMEQTHLKTIFFFHLSSLMTAFTLIFINTCRIYYSKLVCGECKKLFLDFVHLELTCVNSKLSVCFLEVCDLSISQRCKFPHQIPVHYAFNLQKK